LFVLTALLLTLNQALAQAKPETTQDLDVLLASKKYPQLERVLQTDAPEMPRQARAYFLGVMANRLNQPQKSLSLLEPLVSMLHLENAARGEIALCTIADDYAKIFRYGDAARVYEEASRAATQLKVQSTCEAAHEALRWALLKDVPVQSVAWNGDVTVYGKWDSIGLVQVPVTAGEYTGSWILDTGANLSVIRQSVAQQMGIDISNGSGTAEGSSGKAVSVHAGVIPELHLGSATFRNIPVLVAADSDLDFASLNYQIEGSLGLPVLAALGKFSVDRNGSVRFGAASDSTNNAVLHNLFLDKFVPVVTADFGLGDQLFTLDTGAMGTILSAAFYQESRPVDPPEIVQFDLVGAGGVLHSLAYQAHDVGIRLGGSCALIGQVQILTRRTGLADEFYGNIGEDALASFASFTLDFSNMHFSVNGGPHSCAIKP
jgi:predicted aspartyl protease